MPILSDTANALGRGSSENLMNLGSLMRSFTKAGGAGDMVEELGRSNADWYNQRISPEARESTLVNFVGEAPRIQAEMAMLGKGGVGKKMMSKIAALVAVNQGLDAQREAQAMQGVANKQPSKADVEKATKFLQDRIDNSSKSSAEKLNDAAKQSWQDMLLSDQKTGVGIAGTAGDILQGLGNYRSYKLAEQLAGVPQTTGKSFQNMLIPSMETLAGIGSRYMNLPNPVHDALIATVGGGTQNYANANRMPRGTARRAMSVVDSYRQ